jgi:Ubiquinone biosynthesis protein COQ7
VWPRPTPNDQLAVLSSRDHELFALIASIKSEELSHLDHAEKNLSPRGPIVRMLRRLIDAVTEVLIFMSTSGDPVRMAYALAANRKVQEHRLSTAQQPSGKQLDGMSVLWYSQSTLGSQHRDCSRADISVLRVVRRFVRCFRRSRGSTMPSLRIIASDCSTGGSLEMR